MVALAVGALGCVTDDAAEQASAGAPTTETPAPSTARPEKGRTVGQAVGSDADEAHPRTER